MLRTTRKGATLWVGTGLAALAMGLAGCGGHKSSKKGAASTVAAATTGSTTAGAGSGTTALGGGFQTGVGVSPIVTASTPGGSVGGGTVGGTPVSNPGGGSTGGGSTGGGSTGGGSTGGGSTTPPAGVTDDHGNNGSGATALTLGNPRAGLTQYAGDQDWFKVTLSATVSYSFVTSNLAAGMDSIVRLVDTNGVTQLAENDDVVAGDPSSRLDYTPAQSGDYYVIVLHKDPAAAAGGYDLRAVLTAVLPPPPRPDDHGNDMNGATVVAVATPANTVAPTAGQVSNQGDEDWFAVDLVAGQDYSFRTQNLQNMMDPVLSLYESDGTTLIDESTGLWGMSAALSYTPTQDGTYYLSVRHYDSTVDQGDYELVAEELHDDHGDDAAGATALTLASALAGRVEQGGDQDWFAVTLSAFQEYEFLAQNMQNGMDSYLTLYDSDGTTVLGQNDDFPGLSFGSKVTYRATRAGTYYVAIRHYSRTSTGDYEALAQLVGGGAPPAASGPRLIRAQLDDVDGSNDASEGDRVTLTFSEDVTFAPTADPNVEFALPVAGDTFGQGATMTAGASAREVVVTLGRGPVLRLSGTFDPSRPALGRPSGIAVTSSTTIAAVGTQGVAAAPDLADLDSGLRPGFFPGASLVTARGFHSATLLDDGRVLVVGGLVDARTFAPVPEVLDAGVWTETTALGGPQGALLDGALQTGRFDHLAVKLPSGQVLIAGGRGFDRLDASGQPVLEELASAWLFDPVTNTFARTGDLQVARRGARAALLPNGQVLVAGGYSAALGRSLREAEVFDPATGTFTRVQEMVRAREGGTLDVVGGQALVIGGQAWLPTATVPPIALAMAAGAETFDPATGAFAQAAAPLTTRRWHATCELASGDLLVVGGDDGSGAIDSIERYEAATGTFRSAGLLAAPRSRHLVARLGEQDVLLVGGVTVQGGQTVRVSYVSTGELFDTVAGVSEQYQLVHGRNSHTITALPGGKVLVVGGWEAGLGTVTGADGVAVAECELFVRP